MTFVHCPQCRYYQGAYSSKEKAVEAWNHRPTEDKLRARIAELEDCSAVRIAQVAEMERKHVERVRELEAGIKDIDGRVYRSFKKGNCAMLFVHQELEALAGGGE